MLPFLAALAFCSAALPPQARADAESRVALLDHEALSSELRALHDAHDARAALVTIGTSRAGRPIEALRIAAGELRPGRPALLLVAGMEAPQTWTTGLALDHARTLLEGYGEDEAITALLDATTLWVLPRANPDGCERRFETPRSEGRASGLGVDDDRDGRQGEDPPADLDGDGLVTRLRVRDPEGEWIEDPTDPRVLVKADRARGERGVWALHPEGRDADGDERVAEDAPRDTCWNRNFPAQWEEHTARAGRFAGEEPGVRAAMDFVIGHPGIALVVAYGELDDLSSPPATAKDGPRGSESPGRPEADVALLAELGRRYAEHVDDPAVGSRDEAGRFQTWVGQHRGVLCIAVHPWAAPAELPEAEDGEEDATEDGSEKSSEPEPSDEAKRLAWLESHGVDAFREWTAFEHPELGPVEIGGWVPHARSEPPPSLRDAIADEHLAFLLELAGELPRVHVTECTARPLGDDLYEVVAAVENGALLPSTTAAGREAGVVRPLRLSLTLGESDVLLAGPRRALVRELPGAGGRHESRWLVRATDPSTIAVRAASDHAGVSSRTAEVLR